MRAPGSVPLVVAMGSDAESCRFSVMPKLIMLLNICSLPSGSLARSVHAVSRLHPPLPSVGVVAPNTGPCPEAKVA